MQNNQIPTIAKLTIAVLIVVALSEVSPELVNGFLILVLIGIFLTRYEYFKGLAAMLGTLGK